MTEPRFTDEPVVEPWWLDDNMAYSARDGARRMDSTEVAVVFERLAQQLDLYPNYGKHTKAHEESGEK